MAERERERGYNRQVYVHVHVLLQPQMTYGALVVRAGSEALKRLEEGLGPGTAMGPAYG